MKHVAACSFGKDSVATVILAKEHNEPLDEVVYCEVMFDDQISGEVPEHRDFIYEIAKPIFESWGIKVTILRSQKTYLSNFMHVITKGEQAGKIRAFPLCGRCTIQRDCKLPPMEKYKKQIAHQVQKNYDMIITGERRDEGGMRSVPRKDNTSLCFSETSSGQYRLRPLYYVSDADKEWYKNYYGIRYSDAYEIYGLKRTGCCGCPISYAAVDDLEKIRPYEPNVVKAAWNIFGKSYEYRQKYNAYKASRKKEERERRGNHK